MTRLFEAGFVERFRPQTLRGSYQWTYCLARDGYRAAQQTGELAPNLKFAPRREAIFDYRYVIHDLRVNEWVLRYRALLGERLLDWAGPDESLIQPPKGSSVVTADDGEHDIVGVEDEAVRPIQPDARLDVRGVNGEVSVFVEYDRTGASTRTTTSSAATRRSSRAGGTQSSSMARAGRRSSSCARRRSRAPLRRRRRPAVHRLPATLSRSQPDA